MKIRIFHALSIQFTEPFFPPYHLSARGMRGSGGLTGGIKARDQREFPVLTNSPGRCRAGSPGPFFEKHYVRPRILSSSSSDKALLPALDYWCFPANLT